MPNDLNRFGRSIRWICVLALVGRCWAEGDPAAESTETTTTTAGDSAVDPAAGLKFRVTDRGVRYALDLAEKLVNEKLRTARLPGVRVEIDAGPGKGQLEIRRLIVSDYAAPTYSYAPLPPTGLQWGAKEGSLTLKGAWSAWYKFLFKISVDGYFIATMDNLTLSTVLDITRGPDGRPELKVPNCRAQVKGVRVKVTGGAVPKFINVFRGALEEALEGLVRRQVCRQVQTTLVRRANDRIRSLPARVPLRGGPFLLDYRLVGDPAVRNRFLEAAIDGSVTYGGRAVALTAPPVPGSADSARMMYIWITDYVPQSMFSSAQDNGLLVYPVNRNSTPQFAKYLRTTCPSSACIGTFKDQLAEQYPDSYVALDLWTDRAPQVIFSRPKPQLTVQLLGNMFVEPASNETLLLVFQIDIKVSLAPFFKNGKLSGNATVDGVEISVNRSTIGEVSSFELYLLADMAQPALQKRLNDLLAKGVAVPTYEGVELLEPRITVLDRALQIDTDFQYVAADHKAADDNDK